MVPGVSIAKVRETLLSRQKVLEQREKARKLRELKKFGKKVRVTTFMYWS